MRSEQKILDLGREHWSPAAASPRAERNAYLLVKVLVLCRPCTEFPAGTKVRHFIGQTHQFPSPLCYLSEYQHFFFQLSGAQAEVLSRSNRVDVNCVLGDFPFPLPLISHLSLACPLNSRNPCSLHHSLASSKTRLFFSMRASILQLPNPRQLLGNHT